MVGLRLPWSPTQMAGGIRCTTATEGAAYPVGLFSCYRTTFAYIQSPLQAPIQPMPLPKTKQPTSSGTSSPCRLLPPSFNPSFGRYWHQGAAGVRNPRGGDLPSRTPTLQISRNMQPLDLPARHGTVVPFPDQPWVLEKPRLPTRVPAKPLRGCVCLPAMILPESYNVAPAHARAYYMGNDNVMHCLLPCSMEPFCPFHSACGRPMRPDSLETDDHKGHLCSRCKEFVDKGRTPFEWFDSLPDAASSD